MMKKTSMALMIAAILFLFVLFISACGSGVEETKPTEVEKPVSEPTEVVPPAQEIEPTTKASEQASDTSELDGKALVAERCTVCHDLTRVSSLSNSYDGWKTIVERMLEHGANLNSAEQEAVIQYLAETYP